MTDLRDLYQEVVLDHSKRPRNFRVVEHADCASHGHNPLCGDKISVFIKTDHENVEEIGFEGAGCAICMASASMMTESLQGRTVWEVQELFREFHELVTGKEGAESRAEVLGKLIVFGGVRDYPVRVKCATLPWHTMLAALDRRKEAVSTE